MKFPDELTRRVQIFVNKLCQNRNCSFKLSIRFKGQNLNQNNNNYSQLTT